MLSGRRFKFLSWYSYSDSMDSKDIKSIFASDNWELAFVCSQYQSTTEEVNSQIARSQTFVRGYDENAMVIDDSYDEDLEDVTNIDLQKLLTQYQWQRFSLLS